MKIASFDSSTMDRDRDAARGIMYIVYKFGRVCECSYATHFGEYSAKKHGMNLAVCLKKYVTINVYMWLLLQFGHMNLNLTRYDPYSEICGFDVPCVNVAAEYLASDLKVGRTFGISQ